MSFYKEFYNAGTLLYDRDSDSRLEKAKIPFLCAFNHKLFWPIPTLIDMPRKVLTHTNTGAKFHACIAHT